METTYWICYCKTFEIFHFYKLRCKLNSSVMKTLYFAFIYRQLFYDVEMYGNTTKNHIKKLVILNNKILHIAQNKPLWYRVTDLYKNYNTLPLPELHKFQLLCLVHKYYYRNDQLPSADANIFSVNKAVHHYQTRCSVIFCTCPESTHLMEPNVLNSRPAKCGMPSLQYLEKLVRLIPLEII